MLDLEYQEQDNNSKASIHILDLAASQKEIIHNMAFGLEKMFKRVFKINHHDVNPSSTSCIEYYFEKLVHWLVFLGFENELKDWMILYNISPFRPSQMGMNGVHMLCKYQLQESSPLRKFQSTAPIKSLQKILELDYEYAKVPAKRFFFFRRLPPFDMKEALSIRTTEYLNTALHLCCIFRSYRCFETMLNFIDKKNFDIDEVNLKGWRYDNMIPRENVEFIERAMASKIQRLTKNLEEKDEGSSSYLKSKTVLRRPTKRKSTNLAKKLKGGLSNLFASKQNKLEE